MTTHELKTWPEYFKALAEGRKTFEVRKNDRDFKEGDILHLREWHPRTEEYSGQQMVKSVTYVMSGGLLGVQAGYVVMGLDMGQDHCRNFAHTAEMPCPECGIPHPDDDESILATCDTCGKLVSDPEHDCREPCPFCHQPMIPNPQSWGCVRCGERFPRRGSNKRSFVEMFEEAEAVKLCRRLLAFQDGTSAEDGKTFLSDLTAFLDKFDSNDHAKECDESYLPPPDTLDALSHLRGDPRVSDEDYARCRELAFRGPDSDDEAMAEIRRCSGHRDGE